MPSVLNVFASLTLTTALWDRYHYYHTILHMGKLKPEKEGHLLKVTQLVSWRTGLVHSIPLINLHITFTCNISWNEYSIWHNLVNVGVKRTKWGELRKACGQFSIVENGIPITPKTGSPLSGIRYTMFLARNQPL